jgi:hypothetical protein
LEYARPNIRSGTKNIKGKVIECIEAIYDIERNQSQEINTVYSVMIRSLEERHVA